MTWVLTLLLVGLAVGLERLTSRPFLATQAGRLLAWALRAERLEPQGFGALFVAPWVPAIGFTAWAQTWGETVLITPALRAHPTLPCTLAHEAAHVAQYRRYGSLGFGVRYLAEWLIGLARTRQLFGAYWQMPLEQEARAAEQTLTPNADLRASSTTIEP